MDKRIEEPEITAGGIGIAAVERDTGLGKDTLRIWERRYGFPKPLRDVLGERVYPAGQVEHLRLIKRLMDQGQRPGVLLRTPLEELSQRLSSVPSTSVDGETADWVIPLLKNRDIDRLRVEFAQRVARDGLEHFVVETLPALNRRVGDSWMTGELEVYAEHLFTEAVQNQLRTLIHGLAGRGTRPRVLLTTAKDEEHLLGLLMVESLLVANGAWCLSLGAQLPLADIAAAAQGTTIDIVALSFSAAYPWRKAKDTLIELRAALPAHTALWAGGQALVGRGHRISGVRLLTDLREIAPTLVEWQTMHNSRFSAGE